MQLRDIDLKEKTVHIPIQWLCKWIELLIKENITDTGEREREGGEV